MESFGSVWLAAVLRSGQSHRWVVVIKHKYNGRATCRYAFIYYHPA